MKKRLVSALPSRLQRSCATLSLLWASREMCRQAKAAGHRVRRYLSRMPPYCAGARSWSLRSACSRSVRCTALHEDGHLSAPEVPRMLEASDSLTGARLSGPFAQGPRGRWHL
jgi:hypothetical protein